LSIHLPIQYAYTQDSGLTLFFSVTSGGNLLTRSGAVCDGATLAFEEQFDAQYRCHLKGEAQMHYLKYLVLFSASLVVLVSIYQTIAMSLIHAGYLRWKLVHQTRAVAAQAANGKIPDGITPELSSMFKMTRGLVRLIMYYLKPTPPDGDLPGLIAKAVFGYVFPNRHVTPRLVTALYGVQSESTTHSVGPLSNPSYTWPERLTLSVSSHKAPARAERDGEYFE
jgi:hypothetical protein